MSPSSTTNHHSLITSHPTPSGTRRKSRVRNKQK